MLGKRTKIRQRRATGFSPGWVATILFLISGVLYGLATGGTAGTWVHDTGILGASEEMAKVISYIPVIVFAVPAALLAQKKKKQLQTVRDGDIALPGPTAVFLRPFFSDKSLAFINPFYSALGGPTSPENHSLLPAEFVGRVLEPYINVRQLGGTADTFANARVSAPEMGDQWQAAFKEQIHSAAVTVIIPLVDQDKKTGQGLGHATIWELKYLVESGALNRSIVIMPQVAWIQRRRVRDRWERARAMTSSFGLILPEYNKHGAVMTFSREKGIWLATERGFLVRGRKRLSVGLIAALEYLAVQHGFTLLSR